MKSGTRLLLRCVAFLVAVAAVALSPMLGSSDARVEALAAVSSVPADGSSVVTSPQQVSIVFDQPIAAGATMVLTCNGSALATPVVPFLSTDTLSLLADITTPLPKGQCSMFWSVRGAADNTNVFNTYTFKVEQDAASDAAAAAVAAAEAAKADGLTTDGSNLSGPLGLFRLISTIALASLLGALVLITVAWPEGIEYILTIRFLRYAWVLAFVSTVLMVGCLVAQNSGKGFTSSILPTAWGPLTDSTPGIAALARVLLTAAAGWVAIHPERVIDPSSQLAALAAPALAVATLGFSRTGGDLEIVGYAMGVGHALAMAVWFGGLVLLARVVLAGPGEDDLVHAVRGFSRLATPAMLVTIVTGVVQLYRLDRGHLLDTTHGRLLLLKVVPVIGMVFVGVATRQFVHARLARAETMSAPLAGRLRRAVGMEAVIGVLVLAVTSWMLSAQPGNLVASGKASSDFQFQQVLVDTAGKFAAEIDVDPAIVGTNEVLISVSKPASGITNLTVQFDPPVNTFGHGVLMTITDFTAGVTGWYLPPDVGIPLDVPGSWTVTITVVSADGTFVESSPFPVAAADDASIGTIAPTATQPPVTSPATSTTVTG